MRGFDVTDSHLSDIEVEVYTAPTHMIHTYVYILVYMIHIYVGFVAQEFCLKFLKYKNNQREQARSLDFRTFFCQKIDLNYQNVEFLGHVKSQKRQTFMFKSIKYNFTRTVRKK